MGVDNKEMSNVKAQSSNERPEIPIHKLMAKTNPSLCFFGHFVFDIDTSTAPNPALQDGVKSAAQYQPRANPGLQTGDSQRVDLSFELCHLTF
jgi:hypothetical protein